MQNGYDLYPSKYNFKYTLPDLNLFVAIRANWLQKRVEFYDILTTVQKRYFLKQTKEWS